MGLHRLILGGLQCPCMNDHGQTNTSVLFVEIWTALYMIFMQKTSLIPYGSCASSLLSFSHKALSHCAILLFLHTIRPICSTSSTKWQTYPDSWGTFFLRREPKSFIFHKISRDSYYWGKKLKPGALSVFSPVFVDLYLHSNALDFLRYSRACN